MRADCPPSKLICIKNICSVAKILPSVFLIKLNYFLFFSRDISFGFSFVNELFNINFKMKKSKIFLIKLNIQLIYLYRIK